MNFNKVLLPITPNNIIHCHDKRKPCILWGAISVLNPYTTGTLPKLLLDIFQASRSVFFYTLINRYRSLSMCVHVILTSLILDRGDHDDEIQTETTKFFLVLVVKWTIIASVMSIKKCMHAYFKPKNKSFDSSRTCQRPLGACKYAAHTYTPDIMVSDDNDRTTCTRIFYKNCLSTRELSFLYLISWRVMQPAKPLT